MIGDLPPSTWRPQPWKNGGGTTHEIVRWPDVDDYDVRVSVADITTATTFSLFPGYRRWSVLVEPSMIVLATRRGAQGDTGSIYRLAEVGDVVELDGDIVIDATLLDGPTRLLNVIARDGVPIAVGTRVPEQPVRFAFGLDDGGPVPRGHARTFDPPQRIEGRVLWIV